LAKSLRRDFTDPEKKKIITVLSETLKDLGYLDVKTYGEIIEDRGSQITLSTLGQDIVDQLVMKRAPKRDMGPDNKKKNLLESELLQDSKNLK